MSVQVVQVEQKVPGHNIDSKLVVKPFNDCFIDDFMTSSATSPSSSSAVALPRDAALSLVALGQRLRAHRVQQGWTVAEMADRLMCSPTTWRALEGGKPGTGIGVLAHALWLLGELATLQTVAPAPAALAAGRRVRKAAGRSAPGSIAEAERDF